MSPVAHHLLLTVILKALQIHSVTIDQSLLSSLKCYIQSLLSNQFTLVAVLAKAAALLLSRPAATKGNTELTDREADVIATLLSKISQDKQIKRYYSSIILQVLHLLSSLPVNARLFMQCGVVANLQILMENSRVGYEVDIIANILWRIALNSETETQLDGNEAASDAITFKGIGLLYMLN